ncbi:HesB/IscA family protein [Tuwongella immobilis]|uniref:Core domain-containing protein n=1 Tax=Tuwongella immobilis TaxID=692036 RepID=A0A6C2YQ09_9BACT|nr:iron-sulfur cluster assembly accessory protein [Tuwongella immobilis]VIP02972.1 cluster insertion : FeS cluster insertion OS=Rhodopirellula sp. SWK7 GN=RRSWK_01893 PE=4 SV=1: Fe-S_biosyn [Tuwongella immobilis]VTS03004.1 cluster insertion : FeS cluster insertion OS=Rhodopirellula sp. SWK7 GN=RRSWK_01893 PE=4 SV=1: Fe-S_biosyn [Tuwongella immobilis]
MATAETTAPETTGTKPAITINLSERAAQEVLRIVSEQKAAGVAEKLYLRMRVVGGGCSGFQHKLDLDPQVNEKLDEVLNIHGVDVVIDKRSMLYLDGVQVDFHDELNKRGFSISNPSAKSTCGCGSSFSM